jgi:DNA sulfur modification protein DndE
MTSKMLVVKNILNQLLFGEYYDMYLGFNLCALWFIYKTDKGIGRYIKMHVGSLQLLNQRSE